jgi:catechol-2,3-dioxygenase
MEHNTRTQIKTLKAHIALNVSDVKRSTEFYKQMFGIQPSKERDGYAKFDVENPPLNLTLNQVAQVNHGALSHLGIQVESTEDVLAARQNWIHAGLITRDEIATNCCYALQDKTWVQDPDGNQWGGVCGLRTTCRQVRRVAPHSAPVMIGTNVCT